MPRLRRRQLAIRRAEPRHIDPSDRAPLSVGLAEVGRIDEPPVRVLGHGLLVPPVVVELADVVPAIHDSLAGPEVDVHAMVRLGPKRPAAVLVEVVRRVLGVVLDVRPREVARMVRSSQEVPVVGPVLAARHGLIVVHQEEDALVGVQHVPAAVVVGLADPVNRSVVPHACLQTRPLPQRRQVDRMQRAAVVLVQVEHLDGVEHVAGQATVLAEPALSHVVVIEASLEEFEHGEGLLSIGHVGRDDAAQQGIDVVPVATVGDEPRRSHVGLPDVLDRDRAVRLETWPLDRAASMNGPPSDGVVLVEPAAEADPVAMSRGGDRFGVRLASRRRDRGIRVNLGVGCAGQRAGSNDDA